MGKKRKEGWSINTKGMGEARRGEEGREKRKEKKGERRREKGEEGRGKREGYKEKGGGEGTLAYNTS
jgi:hypothetical protein